ncbi:enediyne antibiotic chromoprotein [Actinomadura flavalba]|uniref:enediyne antibiotic chromoprotein n=1 Tax=Actinomadura flavalba TaxID=1120938 RepID=UPI00036DFD30|nr:enediyne antibiotic chromoprotein [Actinomadura flavalba]
MSLPLVRPGAVLVLGLASVLSAPLPSSAAEARAAQLVITANPSTGLASSTAVGVGGRGLNPQYTYYAQQCGVINEATGEWACDPNTRVRLTPDEGGAFSTPLSVRKHFEGVRGNGEYHSIHCGRIQCVVGVAATDGGDATTAPLEFR